MAELLRAPTLSTSAQRLYHAESEARQRETQIISIIFHSISTLFSPPQQHHAGRERKKMLRVSVPEYTNLCYAILSLQFPLDPHIPSPTRIIYIRFFPKNTSPLSLSSTMLTRQMQDIPPQNDFRIPVLCNCIVLYHMHAPPCNAHPKNSKTLLNSGAQNAP
jgi:hypothetical protein